MRLREFGQEYAWACFLAGLPWAFLVWQPLDPWHSQTAWAQTGLVGLFALAYLSPWPHTVNKPVTLWLMWTGLMTVVVWNQTVQREKLYPLPMLMGFCHALSIWAFVQSATMTWNLDILRRILRWVAWSGVVLLAYCGLQALSLDPFFKNLDPSHLTDDQVVGTIGNPSHLGAQLGLLLPVFWLQKGKGWWVVLAVAVGFLLWCRSAAALAGVGLTLVWLTWHWKRWVSIGLVLVGMAVGMAVLTLAPNALYDVNRAHAWKIFWQMLQAKAVYGWGLGAVLSQSATIPTDSPIYTWRHVHNEYLQIAIEQGVIGLGLIAWALGERVKAVWHMTKTPEVRAFVAMLIVFLINAALNFPAHLWVLGSLGLVAYCGLIVCEDAECLPP